MSDRDQKLEEIKNDFQELSKLIDNDLDSSNYKDLIDSIKKVLDEHASETGSESNFTPTKIRKVFNLLVEWENESFHLVRPLLADLAGRTDTNNIFFHTVYDLLEDKISACNRLADYQKVVQFFRHFYGFYRYFAKQ